MGLGMARPGAIISSLPEAEDVLDQEEMMETEEEIENLELSADDEAAAELQATEDEARRQGWRPLAEYRGKPGGWVDAKTFIERGKNYLPFVQKELRETKEANGRMANEMEGLRTEMASTRADMQKLLDFSRRANQAGYDRAVKDLKAQQRDAAANGDLATFDKIGGQLDEMAEARAGTGEEAEVPSRAPVPERQVQPKPGVRVSPDYDQWIGENTWFNQDRVLNAAMIEAHNAIIKESPAMATYDQLEKAKESVMADFPKKFGLDESAERPAPPPRRPAAPLPPRGGSRPGGRPQSDDPFESIADPRERADAKAGYASAKRSMPTLTKAEYLEVFTQPHGDVLDTISRNKPRK